MRVVFVNRYFHPDQSATSRMASALAFDLPGCAVHVITSRQLHGDARRALPSLETVQGVVIHRVATTRFGRARLPGRLVDYASFYASAAACLLRVAQGDVVVVACTDPPLLSVCAAVVCRLSSARLVNWLQDLFPEVASAVGVVPSGGLIDEGLRRLRDLSLRAAAVNVAPGERMAAYLVARGVAPAAVRVIPNWADGEEIRPVPRDANPLRRRWRLAGCFVVGYSGNMGRAHDFRTMLDAAARLRDRADIRFLMVGDGHQRSWIAAEAHRLGLTNLTFRPLQPKEQLADSLGAADVHLVSLRPELEGFVVPSKFYAAAAAGRPVLFVGDPDGEVARLVTAGDYGATVAPEDGAGLALQIRRLADDPALHAALASNARRAFEAAFNQGAATAAWSEALRAAMNAPRQERRAGGLLAAGDG